ncbi:MAG: radical SAM protein [Deltaproteobacteria bacterium]|nr:radical SAM protein [Deltaproteobacteria bacterium]
MKAVHRESGAIKKEWGGKLPVLLVYPDTYRSGMSNLAVHTVYGILNEMDDVVCERCFWRKGQRVPLSMESGRQPGDFSVIAFSISFETDYINVVDFLRAAGIELYASKRRYGPMIMAGGIAVTLNPEPIADFMDACIIGEAEGLADRVMDAVHRGIGKDLTKPDILHALDGLEGVYVPSFYRVEYGAGPSIRGISHTHKAGKKVRRHIADSLDRVPSTVIYTDDTTFSGMHLQEVSRGCAYRCRFCISGYAYLPPRHRDRGVLEEDLAYLPPCVKRVGIVSPMVTDYPHLVELLDHVHSLGLKASLSSMRADSVALLYRKGIDVSTDQFSAAIAPEAGTYRLRKVLNKQLSDEHIMSAVDAFNRLNVNTVKLYFLIGIPTETDEDVSAIAALALLVKKRLRSGKGRVGVSINPLIPKPFTPFQWSGVIRPDEARDRLDIVKGLLKGSGIKVEWEKHYLLQAILSRGDRRLSDFLVYMSDTVRPVGRALRESGVDVGSYAFRRYDQGDALPWDFLDYGFDKAFLYREYRLGLEGVVTPACRPDACTMCGVCVV